MSTNGDYIRPLFPGLDLPDNAKVGLQRAIPVGPVGGMVRDALAHVKPGAVLADDDWVTVTWDDTQQLGDQAPNTGILDEQFAGTVLSSAWFVNAGAVTVGGGRLHLPNTFPVNVIRSVAQHVVVNTSVTVYGLLAPVGYTNDANKARGVMVLDVSNPNVNFLQIVKSAGNITCRTNPGTLFSTPYNATAHANLRMRVAGSLVLFDASPDGTTWSTLGQIATPSWALNGTGLLQLYGGCSVESYADPNTESSIDRVTWA